MLKLSHMYTQTSSMCILMHACSALHSGEATDQGLVSRNLLHFCYMVSTKWLERYLLTNIIVRMLSSSSMASCSMGKYVQGYRE